MANRALLLPASLGLLLLVASGCEDSSSVGGTPDAASPGGPDAGGPPSVAVLTPCPAAPTGAGTVHDKEISADETWTLDASPHRVTFGIRLLAAVTIEPCATVLVDEGYTITVGMDGTKGALVAKGERGVDAAGAPVRRPVTIAAADASKPWGSIAVDPGSTVDLESTDLRDGANPTSDQNGGGVIRVYGAASNGARVVKNLRAVDVTVERSRGYGISFLRLSGFTDDSRDVTVRDGGRPEAPFPIRVEPGALSTVPSGLSLSGNASDEVEIVAGNTAMPSDTIRARGAPYRVSGRLRVAPETDGAPSTLTVEPGVTLRFDTTSDSGLHLGTSEARQGVLVAAGTSASPITFTSAKATPAPADWKNIYFAYSPASGNRIENAVIAYAGGFSGAQGYGCGDPENDASVLLLSGRPAEAFIRSTTFRNGGGDTGIVLGWASDEAGPDFVSPNTFTDMPACHVSRWQNATGERCPGSTGGSPVCL